MSQETYIYTSSVILKFIALFVMTTATIHAYSITDAGASSVDELGTLWNRDTASDQDLTDLAAKLIQVAPELADYDTVLEVDGADDDSEPEVAQYQSSRVPAPIRAFFKALRAFRRFRRPRGMDESKLDTLSSVDAARNDLQDSTDLQRDANTREDTTDIDDVAGLALLNQSSTLVTLLTELSPFHCETPPPTNTNPWTRSSTGCPCHFDKHRRDCACCYSGGSQCGPGSERMCVPGNRVKMCHEFTRAPSGCTCYWDKSRHDCACCYDGGCPCTSRSPHQCVQCGVGTMCER